MHYLFYFRYSSQKTFQLNLLVLYFFLLSYQGYLNEDRSLQDQEILIFRLGFLITHTLQNKYLKTLSSLSKIQNLLIYMQAKGLIYSLVSRGHETVLSSYSAFAGNFPSFALDVLRKCNMSKTFGQYATANYTFYTFSKEGFIFLVMTDPTYESRIAISYLKKIQEKFFNDYDVGRRSSAVAHQLKQFNNVLKDNMTLYSEKSKVDKFSELQQHLTDLEEQSLKNMDKVIERGQKIEILVKKSEVMSDQSLDMKNTARTVKNRMWWKNKKVMIGIVLIVLILLGIVIWIIAG